MKVEVEIHVFLTSALVWSAQIHAPAALTAQKESPVTITEHVLCILGITELYIYKKTLRPLLEVLKLALKRRRGRGRLDAGN
jgi:hypothetical protein